MRRRTTSAFVSTVLAVSVASTAAPQPASAYSFLGCKWATSSINFYVPSPLLSYPVWNNAAAEWNGLHAHFNFGAGNPSNFTGTNENRGNTVAWSGITRQPGTVQTPPPCQNGRWASGRLEVVLNWSIVSGYTLAKRTGVAAHELGHSFGLAHNPSSTAILMYPSDARTVTAPQADDKAGVNALY